MTNARLTLAALVVASSGCLFDFNRGLDLQPGDIAGRVVREDGAAAAYARVAIGGTGAVHRTNADGEFVISGLSAGGWSLRITDDSNGDGLIERAAFREVALTVQRHADGLFGDGEPKLTFVSLGDVQLAGVVEVNGTVEVPDYDGDDVAEVFVLRSVTLPGSDDGAGNVRQDLQVPTGIEARATAGVDPDTGERHFFFPAVAAGDFTLVALLNDGATAYVSEPRAVSAQAGESVDIALTPLVAEGPDTPGDEETRDVQIELAPAPADSDQLEIVLAPPGTAEADVEFGTFDDGRVVPGAASVNTTLPIGGAFDVWLKTESGLLGTLETRVVDRPGEPLLVWAYAQLGDGPRCADAGNNLVDCDHDELPGLPALPEGGGGTPAQIWSACAPQCADAFGSDEGAASCDALGVTYDCDDDGDGQPDVTEPAACRALSAGGDYDGDGRCDAVDPFPDCASNDAADPQCGSGDMGALPRPPVRNDYFPMFDAGVPDAGFDAGPDAGLDAGLPADAGVDAGPVDAGVDAGPATVVNVGAVYPSAADWNEYVKHDGADRWSANEVTCDGSETGLYHSACLHGGELRAVAVPDQPSCAGLVADDELGMFVWQCDDGQGFARFRSAGFQTGHGLTSAIDFSGLDWLDNRVNVYAGATLVAQSAFEKWWTNPIVEDNDGMVMGDAQAGTVYVITTAEPSAHYEINASNVALVVDPTVGLVASSTPLTTSRGLIDIGAGAFRWVEGVIIGKAWSPWIADTGGAFTVVHNTTGVNSGLIVEALFGSRGGHIRDLRVDCGAGGDTALVISDTGGYTLHWSLEDLLLGACGTDVYGESNRVQGVLIRDTYDNQWLQGPNLVVVDFFHANGSSPGMDMRGWGGYVLAHAVTASIDQEGYDFTPLAVGTLSGVSAFTAEGSYGMWIRGTSNSVFEDLLLAGSRYGLLVDDSPDNIFDNVVVLSHAQIGIEMVGSLQSNEFHGVLRLGDNMTDCRVDRNDDAGPSGLIHDTCSDTGADGSSTYGASASSAVLTRGLTAAELIVGHVTDEPANPFHDGGVTTDYDPLLWDAGTHHLFSNEQRAFDNHLPITAGQASGACRSEDCIVWDYSLRTTDTIALDQVPAPDGNDTRVHRWATVGTPPASQADCDLHLGSVFNATDSVCESTHLAHSRELLFDYVGNDNGLCESDEVCVRTRNIGGYQGHGALLPWPGTFQDGTISGVTLLDYENNGR
jgi:hypothetical protein